jgi:hypothetical protein
MRALCIVPALLVAAGLAAQEPELPGGLGGAEPAPPGEPEEPALPGGLGATAEPAAAIPAATDGGYEWLVPKGFFEVRSGVRTQRDLYERNSSIAEARLHLDFEHAFDGGVLRLRPDLLADSLARSGDPDLETGEGAIDLREATCALTPLPAVDLKVGRQILTWGTGDLLFVNDMFPKDWVSFFVGRDDEYLKAPSDAVKLGLFADSANLEFAYTPRFDPDRFVRGERLSYYNPLLGRTAGRDAVQDPLVPDDWFGDDEFALRLSSNAGGFELAAYGYLGRWKTPAGMDAATGRGTFPRLGVYGASARTGLAGGIANVEVGYYDSRQDQGGDDPMIDNSQLRGLVGFERDLPEVAHHLTVGVQYYLEAMLGHEDYRQSLPAGIPERDELRHVVTLRVSKELLEQRLRVSVFTYYSPSDADFYVRASAVYALDDSWSLFAGANWFGGAEDYTFFGQFEGNSNLYVGARYSF